MINYPKLLANSKKIGLFGGSFNPLHVAHLEIVVEVKKKNLVDEIVIIPNYKNPLEKKKYLDSKLRFQILKDVFQCSNFFHLWDYELETKRAVYAVETVKLLKKKFTDKSFYFILGSDSFKKINYWYNYEYLCREVSFILFQREKDKKIDFKQYNTSIDLLLLDSKICNSSSSSIITKILDYQLYTLKLKKKFKKLLDG